MRVSTSIPTSVMLRWITSVALGMGLCYTHRARVRTLRAAARERRRRIFWFGRTPQGRGNPLGKLCKEQLALLKPHGWRAVSPDSADAVEIVPLFVWGTKRGGFDFPAVCGGDAAPRVRQFPQANIASLDDKVLLHHCLRAAHR